MLDKTFDPAEMEQRLYEAWESSGAFKCGKKPGAEAFAIVIPPPNVTGSLHMGHALNNTIQDILIRFERMRGKDVLWQPGMDHAGIATQMVVERQLAASGTNETRHTMGREKFVERILEGAGSHAQRRDAEYPYARFPLPHTMYVFYPHIYDQVYGPGGA